MARPRFYIDSLEGGVIRLEGDEARHAIRARRLAAGELVELFDGRGAEAVGRLRAVGRGGAEVEIVERRTSVRPGAELSIAAAVPKGPRADWMIEKCAELGVARFIPLRTRRSVVEPSAERVARWRRKCIEAAKQCGAAMVMGVDDVTDVGGLIGRFGEYEAVYVADRSAGAATAPAALGATRPRRALAVVGPEGGWEPDELVELIRAGARAVRLAGTVLRIETAAVAMAAVWAVGPGV